MKLLPYDTFTLETSDPLPLVRERLAAQVEPYKMRWDFSRNHAPYQGSLSDNSFKITRIIHYRNSFLPRIQGHFEPLASGTAVRISMGLHPFVTAFLGFWYFTWYSAVIPITLTVPLPDNMAVVFVCLPLVALIAFWYAFWYEAKRSRRELTAILLGTSV